MFLVRFKKTILNAPKDSFNCIRGCHQIDFDRAQTWTPKSVEE